MRLVEAAKPTFARHETFHPRYGWFRKAYAVTEARPSDIYPCRCPSLDWGWQEHGPVHSVLGTRRQAD